MKRRITAMLLGLALVLCTGCGKEAEVQESSSQTAQESTVQSETKESIAETASVESTESSEEKAEEKAETDGPEAITGALMSTFYYCDEESGADIEAMSIRAEKVFIVSPGYEKLKAAIAAYNDTVYEEYWSSINTIQETLNSDTFEEDLEYFYFPWEGETTSYIYRSDSQIFAVLENDYSYLGGAHGSFVSNGFNYEPATGKLLTLKDMVTDYSALCELVIKAIEEEYDTENDLFDYWEEEARNAFDQETVSFLAGENSLHIWFSTYELAPYYVGEVEVTIPNEENPGLMKSDYFHKVTEDVTEGEKKIDLTGRTTGFYEEIVMTLAEHVGEWTFEETRAFLDKSGYAYDADEPSEECDGDFGMKDPENGVVCYAYFWPKFDEDGYLANDGEQYLYMVQYMQENKNAFIDNNCHEGAVGYSAVDDNYDTLYFWSQEELAAYLFCAE